ncbi:hypothetical protein H8E88_08360 [candidate division KSB1 bacterium]|nr:hypothetical protein [candidate division KSB1 bacterium]
MSLKINNIVKKVLILFGSTLVSDHDLTNGLEQFFDVIPCNKENKIWHIFEKRTIHIILIEVSQNKAIFELLIKVHEKYPDMPIIAIGNKNHSEIAAQAFFVGVWDYFRIPYHRDLLVERARVLASKKESF